MDLRPSRDEYFMVKAWAAMRRSTCVRRPVGCVLVNGLGHEIGSGYNGRPAGLPHCNDVHEGYTFMESPTPEMVFPLACEGAFVPHGSKPSSCEATHAEMNAWNQCYDRLWVDTCYVTRSPCVPCIKVLMNTSCRRIVYAQASSDIDKSQELWLRSNQYQQHQPHIAKQRVWQELAVPNPFNSRLWQLAESYINR